MVCCICCGRMIMWISVWRIVCFFWLICLLLCVIRLLCRMCWIWSWFVSWLMLMVGLSWNILIMFCVCWSLNIIGNVMMWLVSFFFDLDCFDEWYCVFCFVVWIVCVCCVVVLCGGVVMICVVVCIVGVVCVVVCVMECW